MSDRRLIYNRTTGYVKYRRTIRDPVTGRWFDTGTGELLPAGHTTNCDTPKPDASERIQLAWRWFRRVTAVFLFLQSLAFVSFMYEECLQTAGFAVKAACDARDQGAAVNAIDRYDELLRSAQVWYDRAGWLSFVSKGAYRSYFYVAAPTALRSYRAQARLTGLAATGAFRTKIVEIGGRKMTCDTWNRSHQEAVGRVICQGGVLDGRTWHYNARCALNCLGWQLRGRAYLEGFDPFWLYPAGSVPGDDGP